MTVQELITTLRMKGVEITPVDGKLKIAAPAGVLTDDDRALLREHRTEIFDTRQRCILVLERLKLAIDHVHKSKKYDCSIETAEAAEAEAALETAIYQFIVGDGARADVESAFRRWLATIQTKRESIKDARAAELFSL